MNTAFDKIASGLADAIAYADGDKTKGRADQAARQNEDEPGEIRGEGAGGDGGGLGAASALAGWTNADLSRKDGC